MTLLNWFAKKPVPTQVEEGDSVGMGGADPTLPMAAAVLGKTSSHASSSAHRKNERQERREMLYAVVRECMTQAGVLSQSYKFKVLSLDSHGRQYLVMMDIPREVSIDIRHFSDIETNIARNAKSRHDLMVTAVYWRIHEQVTAVAPVVSPVQAAVVPALAAELEAFKKASHSELQVPTGEQVKSGARNPHPMPQFADTEISQVYVSPLSGTQFGGLS